MRTVVHKIVDQLQPPSQKDRSLAAKSWGSSASHEHWMGSWACLNEVEVKQPQASSDLPEKLVVGAWNLERCKWVEESAEVIHTAKIDILLATEVDWGMARSKQRHTTKELAEQLGWGYAFGVEFVELGLGDPLETAEFNGVPNEHGLHGNAILSRWPLQEIKLITLDRGGLWYVQSPKQDGQHRVGGRMAIAALLDTEKGPLGCAAVHYESESNPDHRNQQTQRLMELLVQEYGTVPMVIGGDLNTNTLSEAHTSQTQRRIQPESWEPSFSTFANYNFAWQTANTGQTTTRRGPHHSAHTPHRTLDWLLLRSCQGSQSRVVPALSKVRNYLSDHEMVVSTVSC